MLELYGRESGDFLGALLEGADIRLYGQGQCHVGMKAGSGSIFVLQDALNTCCYAAHGGTFSVWDSGSRFAVAGQNKVLLDDGETPAQGFKSIHFGTPNEYAFEYLMSGRRQLAARGAGPRQARRARRAQSQGQALLRQVLHERAPPPAACSCSTPRTGSTPRSTTATCSRRSTDEEWRDELAPFLAAEARAARRPDRVEGDDVGIRLEGEWRRWRFDECFIQLVPLKVSRRLAKRGVTPPQLAQLVEE